MEEFGMTSHYWDGDIEKIIGRLWSRKWNGFSIIWDGGITKGMSADLIPWYHRGGDKNVPISTGLWTLGRGGVVKVLHAPSTWVDRLPEGVPLHGELWFNDSTEYLKTNCKRHNPNTMYWNPVKFKVFSVKPYSTFENIESVFPEVVENKFYKNKPQGVMLSDAKEIVSTNRSLEFVEMTMINSKQQALEVVEKFVIGELGNWEGIMFLDPNLKYEGKRSYGVLKYKPSFEDEAIVTGYEEGKTGSRVGLVGTILAEYTIGDKCKNICGYKPGFEGLVVPIRISGLNQAEQDWDAVAEKYPIGSEIRFGYKMFSDHGNPQSCNIYRGM